MTAKQQHEAIQRQVEAHEQGIQELREQMRAMMATQNQTNDMLRTVVANQNRGPHREGDMEAENVDYRRYGTRGIKLDFPHFAGADPEGWIFKATYYFDFHQTSPAQKATHGLIPHGGTSTGLV